MNKQYELNDIINVVFTMTVKDENGNPAMVGEVDGYTVVVYQEHITSNNIKKVIVDLMGESTPVRVIEKIEEEKFIIGDVKEFLDKGKELIIQKLKDGENIKAKIVKFLSYGAYVECDGVGGFLKDVDFSNSYIPVRDVYKIGDEIEVKLLRMSITGKISFEAAEKYTAEEADISTFNVGDVRTGKVVSTKTFGTFVRLGVNLDAICPPLKSIVVEEGDKVVVEITEVIPESRRVRALIQKIVRS